ncbi:MAG TPA: hypothetical protein RMH99_15395 [Sandaracinaceae bacterium LLY-WYZ-13_1]|nr:hypothetical protein [Sandaracinaceae bacterium LLY-WYZ-13_1]
MSVETQVARLESLLERIQANRRPLPTASAAPEAVASAPAAAPAEPSAEAEAPAPRVSPTPMEQALEVELDQRHEEDEPEVEITVEEEEAPQEGIPTAPVGTRAPAGETGPQPVDIAPPAQASEPVARVVTRPQPRTFGELMARTLALRPR